MKGGAKMNPGKYDKALGNFFALVLWPSHIVNYFAVRSTIRHIERAEGPVSAYEFAEERKRFFGDSMSLGARKAAEHYIAKHRSYAESAEDEKNALDSGRIS